MYFDDDPTHASPDIRLTFPRAILAASILYLALVILYKFVFLIAVPVLFYQFGGVFLRFRNLSIYIGWPVFCLLMFAGFVYYHRRIAAQRFPWFMRPDLGPWIAPIIVATAAIAMLIPHTRVSAMSGDGSPESNIWSLPPVLYNLMWDGPWLSWVTFALNYLPLTLPWLYWFDDGIRWRRLLGLCGALLLLHVLAYPALMTIVGVGFAQDWLYHDGGGRLPRGSTLYESPALVAAFDAPPIMAQVKTFLPGLAREYREYGLYTAYILASNLAIYLVLRQLIRWAIRATLKLHSRTRENQ